MKITKTRFEGLLIIEPDVFPDSRGYSYESFNEEVFAKCGIKADFVQDNISSSKRRVLRGMHFQKAPFEQAKLVAVIKGKIFDVVVDLRRNQPTYGKWFSIELSSMNKKMLLVPKGFAHGFLTLEKDTIMHYKFTNCYKHQLQAGIRWDDPELKIDWQFKKYGINKRKVIVSDKDKNLPYFKEIENREPIAQILLNGSKQKK